MAFFLILFSFLFLATTSPHAQNILSVSAEGSVELPANVIRFDINLNAEADSPENAFELHKEREEVLVQLLDEYQIKESDIDFQPVSISKSRHYPRPDNKEVITYQTRQLVSLTLGDFDNYEKIQIELIKAGFDNFSGRFLSSEEESGKDQALKRAIQTAKEKAGLIAEEAGVKLGAISKISYQEQQHRPYEAQSSYARAVSSDSKLMKYDQTVVVKATVQIDFEIAGSED